MKYLLIIGDGMADNPLAALGGITPLEAAEKPELDRLSRLGEIGSVRNVPEGFPPGSDTAIMTIFGCSPHKYYSGRAPIEAAAQGIRLYDGDAAMRCNNVTLSEADTFGKRLIISHCGSGIDGESGRALAQWVFSHPELAPLLESVHMELFPTKSYRHIAVMRGVDIAGLTLSPPHDHLLETVADNLPRLLGGAAIGGSPLPPDYNGSTLPPDYNAGCAPILSKILEKASELLETHPINLSRAERGEKPANGIWFWAEGTAAALQSFPGTYGKTGGVVSAVPLCHGIARLVGLDVLTVEGATGEVDTNYAGKVAAALSCLEKNDFAAVHLEGPDECTHCGDLPGKITAIERLSELVVRPLVAELTLRGEDFRMLILSDHKTLMEEKGVHDGTPVPYLIYDSRESGGNPHSSRRAGSPCPVAPSGLSYSEKNAETGRYIDDGTELIARLFEREAKTFTSSPEKI